MTSDERRLRLALTIAMIAGCGQGVHDLSVSSAPLVVIHGHVDVASLTRVDPSTPLLGALVWAGLPEVNPVCVEFQNTRIAPACPDPFGVFTGAIESSVAVGADGNFDLPLYHLPSVSVSVGDAVTRIAYGTLLVIEDVNGDGQPSFVAPQPMGERRRGPTISQPTDPDRIVGATFYDLHASQQRVVFREGGFVEDSYFYPAPTCATPPPGFSAMTTGAYVDATHAAEPCTISTTDTRLEAVSLSPSAGLALECRAVQAQPNVQQPVADEPPRGNPTTVCLGTNVLATVYSGTCPYLRSYALAGCQQDPMCADPEWNLTLSPPSWWTCP